LAQRVAAHGLQAIYTGLYGSGRLVSYFFSYCQKNFAKKEFFNLKNSPFQRGLAS
jgi:hypothetical protein